MSERSQADAVIYAKDPKRVAAFYEQVAGLRDCGTVEDHVLLESDAFQLVIFRIPERMAKTIIVASPPARRQNGAIKLVFLVGNIAQARETAVKHGGTLDDAGREWRFDGATVCDGCDPEGNVFQLRQPQAGKH